MIKSKLISVEKLSSWFGGSATVMYNKSRREYRIILHNDDNDGFTFCFTDMQYFVHGEHTILVKMLEKYLTTM